MSCEVQLFLQLWVDSQPHPAQLFAPTPFLPPFQILHLQPPLFSRQGSCPHCFPLERSSCFTNPAFANLKIWVLQSHCSLCWCIFPPDMFILSFHCIGTIPLSVVQLDITGLYKQCELGNNNINKKLWISKHMWWWRNLTLKELATFTDHRRVCKWAHICLSVAAYSVALSISGRPCSFSPWSVDPANS